MKRELSTIDKITHSILANQIALNNNESIKHTAYYKGWLKIPLNNVLSKLYKCEPEYDDFFNKESESVSHCYDAYDNYIKTVASVPIWDCKNIIDIIEAYKKDPKSIEGITKKILR